MRTLRIAAFSIALFLAASFLLAQTPILSGNLYVPAIYSIVFGDPPDTDNVSIKKTAANQATVVGNVLFPTARTATRCTDSAGDAACSAAPAGSVVVDAADTATVVSTTAVTANSHIFLQIDASLGTLLSVTCNTQDGGTFDPRVTARTAATSFTVTVDTGPTTNPLCLSYYIIN